jgi:hypothetical protein
VVLCDLEGRPRKEAAHSLGIPEGTLSSRLATARQLLAGQLTRRGLTLSAGAVAALLARQASAASVPPTLLASTVQAASQVAGGQALTVAVSHKVVLLTEGVVKAMFVTKLKTITAVGALLALLGGGVGLVGHTTWAGTPEDVKTSQAKPGKDRSSAGPITPEGRLNRQVEKKLLATISVNYQQVPLGDILDNFRENQALNIVVDRPAAAEAGLNLDQAVSLRLQGVTLKTALKHVLHDAGFGYTMRDGVLIVTPAQADQSRMVRRVYPVADLLGQSADAENLIRIIRHTVEPSRWAPRSGEPEDAATVQGGGTIEYFPEGMSLVISQAGDIQDQIQELLDDLRVCKKEQEKKLQPSGAAR